MARARAVTPLIPSRLTRRGRPTGARSFLPRRAGARRVQVYKATTRGGAEVAVKVRRPGVVAQVALDCHAVRLLLQRLQVRHSSGRALLPGVWVHRAPSSG